MGRKPPLIDEAGGRVAGKPAAKVRERHGHGLGDDCLPGGPVRPAAHRPPGHHARPGLIDKEPPVVRPCIERAWGFDGCDHKAIERATLRQQLPLYPKDPIRSMVAGSLGAHFVPPESRLTPPAHRESKQGLIHCNFWSPLG